MQSPWRDRSTHAPDAHCSANAKHAAWGSLLGKGPIGFDLSHHALSSRTVAPLAKVVGGVIFDWPWQDPIGFCFWNNRTPPTVSTPAKLLQRSRCIYWTEKAEIRTVELPVTGEISRAIFWPTYWFNWRLFKDWENLWVLQLLILREREKHSQSYWTFAKELGLPHYKLQNANNQEEDHWQKPALYWEATPSKSNL